MVTMYFSIYNVLCDYGLRQTLENRKKTIDIYLKVSLYHVFIKEREHTKKYYYFHGIM